MKRYCFTCDLKDDPALIAEYEAYHRAVWPEILDSIRRSGILDMTIYRFGNRMFMIMDTRDDFSLEEKGKLDAADIRVGEWETLMWKYQQEVPGAQPREKWVQMDQIFKL